MYARRCSNPQAEVTTVIPGTDSQLQPCFSMPGMWLPDDDLSADLSLCAPQAPSACLCACTTRSCTALPSPSGVRIWASRRCRTARTASLMCMAEASPAGVTAAQTSMSPCSFRRALTMLEACSVRLRVFLAERVCIRRIMLGLELILMGVSLLLTALEGWPRMAIMPFCTSTTAVVRTSL